MRDQCRQKIALAIQLEREDSRVGSRQEVSRMQLLSGCRSPLHTRIDLLRMDKLNLITQVRNNTPLLMEL